MRTGLCAAVRGFLPAHRLPIFKSSVSAGQSMCGLCAAHRTTIFQRLRRSNGCGCARVLKKPAHPRTDLLAGHPRTETRAQSEDPAFLLDAPLTLKGPPVTTVNHRAKAEELIALADDCNLSDEEQRNEAAVLTQMAIAHALLDEPRRPMARGFEIPHRP